MEHPYAREFHSSVLQLQVNILNQNGEWIGTVEEPPRVLSNSQAVWNVIPWLERRQEQDRLCRFKIEHYRSPPIRQIARHHEQLVRPPGDPRLKTALPDEVPNLVVSAR